jgi:hypothetical protein
MKMQIRNGREMAGPFRLLSIADGTRAAAEARRSAIAHCLAQALAVRVLRRYQRGQRPARVQEVQLPQL